MQWGAPVAKRLPTPPTMPPGGGDSSLMGGGGGGGGGQPKRRKHYDLTGHGEFKAEFADAIAVHVDDSFYEEAWVHASQMHAHTQTHIHIHMHCVGSLVDV